MNVLVIGATGGTGRNLVEQALAQGHTVRALVRSAGRVSIEHDRLSVLEGDILDPAAVDRAVRGMDAVVSALGHKRWFVPSRILSEGTRNIVEAMQRHGVHRLVCETSLGVGYSRGKLGLYYTLFVIPFITYFYFCDKERQEQIITDSGLEWIIVRPGRLTDGRRRGVYRHGSGLGSLFLTRTISRADVADFMLRQLFDATYLRDTPAVVY